MSSKEQFLALQQLHQKMPLFFQPWWLDAVCSHWDVVLSGDDAGAPQAVWPFQIEKIAGLTILRNPLLTPYLGPFRCAGDRFTQPYLPQRVLKEMFNRIPKFSDFQLFTAPYINCFVEMRHLGFSNRLRRTYYLDIAREEDDLWKNIHPRRRNYIRRAGRRLQVVKEEHPDMRTFYQWHRHAFRKKQQAYPYTVSFLERVIIAARRKRAALFLTAYDENKTPVAMLWTPFDHDKAYHLLGAYNPQCPVNGAMDLLVWEAIRNARGAGKRVYDFEGSMDPGIAAFFSKFGGTPVDYFEFHQNRSLLWRLKQWLF